MIEGRTEIPEKGVKKVAREREREGVIGHFSPTFRSRTRDNAHIFYAHENRGREGEEEGGGRRI